MLFICCFNHLPFDGGSLSFGSIDVALGFGQRFLQAVGRSLQVWLRLRKTPLAALGSLRQVVRLVVLVLGQLAPYADRLVALDAEERQGFFVKRMHKADGSIHALSCSLQLVLRYVEIGLKLADSTRRHMGTFPAGGAAKRRAVGRSEPIQAGKAERVEAGKELGRREDFPADGTRQVLPPTGSSGAR